MSSMGNIFRSSRIAASGLRASRTWMNSISNNIANMHTLDTGKSDKMGNFVPYSRQVPIFSKVMSEEFRKNKVNNDVLNGVAVKEVAELKGKVNKVYDPTHPAARKAGSKDAGYVYYPSISLTQEMADIKIASASYEANISVVSVSKKMMQQALGLNRRA